MKRLPPNAEWHGRLVTVLPLGGDIERGYRIYIDERPEAFWHDTYIVVDYTDGAINPPTFTVDTFHQALNLALRNLGWAVRAHDALEEELA